MIEDHYSSLLDRAILFLEVHAERDQHEAEMTRNILQRLIAVRDGICDDPDKCELCPLVCRSDIRRWNALKYGKAASM
jgi:hypothetical protein